VKNDDWSTDIVFSNISLELINDGLIVDVVGSVANVVVVGRLLMAVVCMTVVSSDGFTGFTFKNN
jgi:hypothetical protein